MKTSWVIGVVMMYFIIFGLEVMAAGEISFANPVTSAQMTFLQPEIAEGSSNFLASAWATIIHGAAYIQAFLGVFILWEPTVFSGWLIWAWWGFCLPVAVSMVFGVVGMMRGVHSA